MDRRSFVAAGVGGALGAPSALWGARAVSASPARPAARAGAGLPRDQKPGQSSVRALFPRLEQDTFLDAAGGTPLGAFAEVGLDRYREFARFGRERDYVNEMLDGIRGRFGRMIGADPVEIGLVHCTKAGEQIVLDGLDPIRTGRNVVTNDMHFSGSLHNLVGLRRAGLDLRIVRARDWDVTVEAMAEAIDDDTALVSVTLVSNVTGRIEPMRELADVAHRHGALVYADIIQAAGAMPLDMRELGIDFAACSGYKWLFGLHGVGFLYVRQELQGAGLPDRLFPGSARYNYAPWVEDTDPEAEPLLYREPTTAARYQPGHISYHGYCALYEGLGFLGEIGLDAALAHSVRLNRRLLERIDLDRHRVLSTHVDASPVLALALPDPEALRARFQEHHVYATIRDGRLRVSPAVYNDEGDIDRLARVLNAA